MTDCATNMDNSFIHTQSVQPFACYRKLKIQFVVESEDAACESVDGWSHRFVNSESTLQSSVLNLKFATS
jgi:hypothetical protein